jgi:hypothetical protein
MLPHRRGEPGHGGSRVSGGDPPVSEPLHGGEPVLVEGGGGAHDAAVDVGERGPAPEREPFHPAPGAADLQGTEDAKLHASEPRPGAPRLRGSVPTCRRTAHESQPASM